jgi:hypothetical protein
LLGYRVNSPRRDPLVQDVLVQTDPKLTRTLSRLSVDSARQRAKLSLPVLGSSQQMIESLDATSAESSPRELTLELTTRRSTRPIYSPLSKFDIDRPDLSLDSAKTIAEQIAGIDDLRLTLAGVGDPLLHPQCVQIIETFQAAGVRAIHVETDLLDIPAEVLTRLVDLRIDVLSVHLPALTQPTYAAVMGVERLRDVLKNVSTLVTHRAKLASGLPIIVPTFTKCEDNLAEMESWYDQWLKALGSTVIAGPSDFAGAIASRMTVLSDGRIASCEVDFDGQQSIGKVNSTSIARAFNDGLAQLRSAHASQQLDPHPVCAACGDWDRP